LFYVKVEKIFFSMPSIRHLPAAPRDLLQAVEVFLAENVCAAAGPHAVAWCRLLLVSLARRLGVSGASFASVVLASGNEVIEKIARCLTLLLPDVAAVHAAMLHELEKLKEIAGRTGVAAPPAVDFSPARAASPSPVPPAHNAAPPTPPGTQPDWAALFAQLATALGGRQASPLSAEAESVFRRVAVERSPFLRSHESTVEDGFEAVELARLRVLPPYVVARNATPSLVPCLRRLGRCPVFSPDGTLAMHGIEPYMAQISTDLRIARRQVPLHIWHGVHLALTHLQDRVAVIADSDRHAVAALAELAILAEPDGAQLHAQLVRARLFPALSAAEAAEPTVRHPRWQVEIALPQAELRGKRPSRVQTPSDSLPPRSQQQQPSQTAGPLPARRGGQVSL